MSNNPLNDISRIYLEQIATEAFVDPEHGEAPSGRTPLQNVSDHPNAFVRKKAVKAFKKQMGKEYGGTWKSRSKDPVAESTVGDRARSAVADDRLSSEQEKTSASMDKLRAQTKRHEKSTALARTQARIAAKKSEYTARAMHPKPGVSGYRMEEAKPDYLDFDDDGNKKESMKKSLKDKAKQKMEEAKKPNDGNLANNYPPYDEVTRGDVVAGRLGKDEMGGKKKVRKESFSNWREDLIEIADAIEKKEPKQLKEKDIDNSSLIKINPVFKEAIENFGGTILEMNEFDGVLDEFSDLELNLLSNKIIEEIVEEFFYECIEEGYDVEEIENVLCESLDISQAILTEAKVTYGHDTDIKSDRVAKVKTAVKKVGGAIARGAGYVAGAAVRGVRAAGREFSRGYERGRGGSSASTSSRTSSSSRTSGTSGTSTSSTAASKPGLLSRIGSKLKSGLRKAVASGARAVSRGARNLARKVEGGEKKEAPKAAPKAAEKPADPWEGSATTPPKAKAKKAAAKPKATAAPKAPAKKKKASKLDTLLADIRKEETEIEEGMTMKAFKQQRSRQKQKEKRAADKIAPNRRKDIHTDSLSPERAARHRANVDPDFEGNDERNYPGGKLKNPKKIRKAKALGEIGEAVLDEKITANTDMGMAIKDFYTSKSPQLAGRTKEERRKAAIAAVLTARRGGRKLGEDMMPMSGQELQIQRQMSQLDARRAKLRQQQYGKMKKPEVQQQDQQDQQNTTNTQKQY